MWILLICQGVGARDNSRQPLWINVRGDRSLYAAGTAMIVAMRAYACEVRVRRTHHPARGVNLQVGHDLAILNPYVRLRLGMMVTGTLETRRSRMRISAVTPSTSGGVAAHATDTNFGKAQETLTTSGRLSCVLHRGTSELEAKGTQTSHQVSMVGRAASCCICSCTLKERLSVSRANDIFCAAMFRSLLISTLR